MPKVIIMDLDNTICKTIDGDYINALPDKGVIEKMRDYKRKGFKIVISTSRNMRTYECNVGKINIYTLPVILEWLDSNNVPYDEVLVGKPWCGNEGFYVDDKAIRPSEFSSLNYSEIEDLLGKEL